MILDNLRNAGAYRGLSANLDKALYYIMDYLNPNMETGVHEIEGKQVYAVCAEYETRDFFECRNEAHRKYIDIQILLEGSETIYVSDVEELKVTEEYDEEKDVLFLLDSTEEAIHLKQGKFCIFFPWDAHKPGINANGGSAKVRKAVIKVHV